MFIIFIQCVISLFVFSYSQSQLYGNSEYKTPGNFKDGSFGEYSMKRVPFPPPSDKSIEIIKIQQIPYVKYSLRVDDPWVSDASRCELTVPQSFYIEHETHTEMFFTTIFIKNGIWIDRTKENISTAAVIGQYHDVSGSSPPIGMRILNNGMFAITVECKEERKILYTEKVVHDLVYTLKFNVKWSTHDGFIEAFLNGKLVVDYKGPVGSKGQHYYFKYGVYDPVSVLFIYLPFRQTLKTFQKIS